VGRSWGWGFRSEEHLPGKCKALSFVPSTRKKKGKIEKKSRRKKTKNKKQGNLVERF
jgi:hypothetical protein